jgi:predicted nucleic acid-binding Zn ribbon protein
MRCLPSEQIEYKKRQRRKRVVFYGGHAFFIIAVVIWSLNSLIDTIG